ncbi:methionyl-tRNA formyltransferase [Clostridium perfringens]|uniref:Methionyl-tRNA formyltransferase n=1 Tax=Clostridium perfringens F262 TaxID=883064 RepID=A0AAV3FED4_CLOPF|nr:methionyl-tRNA formyltransferase [Clostridium perfringens]EIA17631.1 methionyl-tRNA formyltransferase [Clostridium perfringens F262]ELC8366994.1 methionyl-tRNA formyltransferase [Clostridium perfringens]MBO3343544.1 methionyl-tRNA formyltransferase [Clostridium perfringens]MBO3346617.1 methionyl-tRNA formyltransferase [Clostridium perfringens]MBO3349689.1 methionyl-tRNA formyltransferase [Clostridium perfringens]
MKIVFMGTPDFSVPSLKKMIEKYNVSAIVTQPDKPSGRGKKVSISPIKKVGLSNEIPIFQPEKIRTDSVIINKLKELKPDFIIVVAYGQILTKEILDIPRLGCICLHASLLPMYRGSAPINWSLINGETKTGNTTILMDTGIDTGDMLMRSEVEISESMTAGELYNLLKINGAELLEETINGIITGKICGIKQPNDGSSYVKMLNKQMANINWNDSSTNIHNLIRGLSSWPYKNINSWPTAYTYYKDIPVKIFKSKSLEANIIDPPGYIIDANDEGIKVATKNGILIIEILQFPGGKPLEVKEFLKGNKIEKGIILS